MGPAAVIVGDPLLKDASELGLVQRHHEIRAFPADRADQPLAKRVRLPGANRRFEDRQAHSGKRRIDALRKDGVAVVDRQSIGDLETACVSDPGRAC